MLSWKVWAKGIAAALIGGGASAVAAAVTAPGIMNGTRGGWMLLLRMSTVGGVECGGLFEEESAAGG